MAGPSLRNEGAREQNICRIGEKDLAGTVKNKPGWGRVRMVSKSKDLCGRWLQSYSSWVKVYMVSGTEERGQTVSQERRHNKAGFLKTLRSC